MVYGFIVLLLLVALYDIAEVRKKSQKERSILEDKISQLTDELSQKSMEINDLYEIANKWKNNKGTEYLIEEIEDNQKFYSK